MGAQAALFEDQVLKNSSRLKFLLVKVIEANDIMFVLEAIHSVLYGANISSSMWLTTKEGVRILVFFFLQITSLGTLWLLP